MALFGGAASNKSQPIAGVYFNAATLVDSTCGAAFVNSSITAVDFSTLPGGSGKPSATSAAAPAVLLAGSGGWGVFALVAALAVSLL